MLSCLHNVSKKKEKVPEHDQIRDVSSSSLRVFDLKELKKATKNFSSKRSLNDGLVFKGFMSEAVIDPSSSSSTSKIPVVIKAYDYSNLRNIQREDWQDELNFLGRLSHPNLVCLLGYCWGENQLFLVSEYIPKGSLINHLFNGILSWDQRMSIASGVAQGISFLCSSCSDETRVYAYFRPSRILIDQDYNAKISVFGLARFTREEGNQNNTDISKGSEYYSPEYINSGHTTKHSIVYSFGVLLLMMLIGVLRANRSNIEYWKEQLSVSDKPRLLKMIDSGMKGQYKVEVAFKVAQYTTKCLSARPANRPSTQEVASEFSQLLNESST